MPTLSDARIAELLQPYLSPEQANAALGAAVHPASELIPLLSRYLDLLVAWNARTNLSAIRDPEGMVRRHFGESLFAADLLRDRLRDGDTLLDFGSGAGFPGLPIQLRLPGLRVTLAESQGKKAAFLREAARTLGLGIEVWSSRVEALPGDRSFSCVALRAVDKMQAAIPEARRRVTAGGWMVQLLGEAPEQASETYQIPGLRSGVVVIERIPE